MLEVIISAVMSFVGTNIDDLFVDTIFFAEAEGETKNSAGMQRSLDLSARAQTRSIVMGKYLGVGVLVFVSLLGAFGLQLLPGKYIGFLGLVPMGLGVKAAIESFRERKSAQTERVSAGVDEAECFEDGSDTNKSEEVPHLQKRGGLLWSVALVTIANGADNIGVYVPLFAGYELWQLGVLVCVFAVMIAVWCLVAKRLADWPLLKGFLLKHKGVIVPIVFVTLGVYIMVENFLL